MKKLLLAGAVALFGLSNAQIAQGTTYLSGTVGYSSTENNNNDRKVDNFRVIPTVGYFVGTNVAIGVGVGYASNVDKMTVDNAYTKTRNSAVVVEPFARKYWTLGEKFYIFGQLSVPMEFGTDKRDVSILNNTTSTKATYNAFGVSIKPGLDYFLNKNWTIEATIGDFGYSNFKYKNAKSIDNYRFGLDLASVSIGVKYVFAK
ncbi:opacity protein [Chryseobacterium piperi]|uniref:Opacity protein n=1 Tax=Chryseobacterium piperi TaxID=558152 RepID=A0A086BLA3_9FLAO|nr:outer membrane beta-barrel protein [Chryseobacterium piperi]ASW73369.1 porin family protein [Chryseobacterium piperi]KFF29717.1 opacity protein [Chryseobacterium piperi]